MIPINFEIEITESNGDVTGTVTLLIGQDPAGSFDAFGTFNQRNREISITIVLGEEPLDLAGTVSSDSRSIIFPALDLEVFKGGGGANAVLEGFFIGRLGSFEVPLLGLVNVSMSLDIFQEEPGRIAGFFDTRIGGEFFDFGEMSALVSPPDEKGDRTLDMTFIFESGRQINVQAVVPFDLRFIAMPQFNLRFNRARFIDGTLEQVVENRLIIANEFTDERVEVEVNRNTRFNIFTNEGGGEDLEGPETVDFESLDDEFDDFEEFDFGPEPELFTGLEGLENLQIGAFTFVLAVSREGQPLLALEVEQGSFEAEDFFEEDFEDFDDEDFDDEHFDDDDGSDDEDFDDDSEDEDLVFEDLDDEDLDDEVSIEDELLEELEDEEALVG